MKIIQDTLWRASCILLCLGATPSHTSEGCKSPATESYSVQQMGHGSLCLLLDEPEQALVHFQHAEALLDRTDPTSHDADFLIAFVRVIACDVLGWEPQREQSIRSLLSVLPSCDEEDQEVGLVTEQDLHKGEEAVVFLRSLAAKAVSPDVQELLRSMLDEISEQLRQCVQPVSTRRSMHRVESAAPVLLCKWSWKRCKKVGCKVLQAVRDAREIYAMIQKFLNDLKDEDSKR